MLILLGFGMQMDAQPYVYIPMETARKALAGKNVLWLGTSIPRDCTYPTNASVALGMNCINHSAGSSFLTYQVAIPPFSRSSGYSLTTTQAESDSLYSHYVEEGLLPSGYLNEWKWTSYESRVMECIKEMDFVIIDHGYNDDIAVMNDYNLGEENIDWDSEDRTTFTGAFKYLYNRIKEASPNVTIAIGGYFQNQCTILNSARGKYVAEVSTWIARHYGIPLLDTWNYIDIPDGYAPNSANFLDSLNAKYGKTYEKMAEDEEGNIPYFQLFCPDGVHPWSDPTKASDRELDTVFTYLLSQRLTPYALTGAQNNSIAVFGGSASKIAESYECKRGWIEDLNLNLYNFGINGAGFSTLSQNPCIQSNITEACTEERPSYDIYLLWASSNDYQKAVPIGTNDDYTEADNYDESKLETMLGGLNFSYSNIKKKAPNAKIILFTSLPVFSDGTKGCDSQSTEDGAMINYVKAEKAWAKRHNIPYLDLFNDSGFDTLNYTQYYKADHVHLTEDGYVHIRPITTDFIHNILLADSIQSQEVDPSFINELLKKGYVYDKAKDLSQMDHIKLDQPTLPIVNLHSKYGIPYTKTSNFKDTIEYFDPATGYYFCKRAIVNAQGASSLHFKKRGMSFEFCDDNWKGEIEPEIDFKDWVSQSEFHLKAYYNDWIRGASEVCYKLYDEMSQTYSPDSIRIWQRAGITDAKKNARCFPDGFPCQLYLNGTFYGIYTWQLKKHTATHIHLDGNLSESNIWDGTIIWKNFEIRNPKDIYTMSGKVYDKDAGEELIDETSSFFNLETDPDSVRVAKQRSADVKHYLTLFSQRVNELKAIRQRGASEEEIRDSIASHFDVSSIIDYLCLSIVTNHYDGYTKNWQWLTYDGNRWFVAPYDLDCTFGNFFLGYFIFPPEYSYVDSDYTFTISRRGIATWFWDYYFDDIAKRYAELRDDGIFDAEHISQMLHEWHDRIGDENYDMEYETWPDSPCNSETLCNPGWAEYDSWENFYYVPYYDEKTTYHAGDLVRFDYRLWLCTEETTGVKPYIQMGYQDNLERYDAWIARRIELEDQYFGYEPKSDIEEVESDLPYAPISEIYSLNGVRQKNLHTGLNIIRQVNGKTRKIYIK